jgi:hypothetical protein
MVFDARKKQMKRHRGGAIGATACSVGKGA